MLGKVANMSCMVAIPIALSHSPLTSLRILIPGYFANTSLYPSIRAVLAGCPVTPLIATTFPLWFNLSANHCAEAMAQAFWLIATLIASGEATSVSVATIVTPCFLASAKTGLKALASAGLTKMMLHPLAIRFLIWSICPSRLTSVLCTITSLIIPSALYSSAAARVSSTIWVLHSLPTQLLLIPTINPSPFFSAAPAANTIVATKRIRPSVDKNLLVIQTSF